MYHDFCKQGIFFETMVPLDELRFDIRYEQKEAVAIFCLFLINCYPEMDG